MTPQSTPDPIAILLAEHRIAEERFAAFDAALAGVVDADATTVQQAVEAARATLAFLDADLEVHIRKEEEPLFPLLKAALPAGDRLIDEMVAEHDQARLKRDALRAVLDQILGARDHDAVRGQREAFPAAVTAMGIASDTTRTIAALRHAWRDVRETLRVHFQNEEELVFPLAPRLLSAAQLAGVGREMVAIDAQAAVRAPDQAGRPLMVDAPEIVAELLAAPELARVGRTARTLAREGSLRVVLLALRAGGRVAEHRAPGPVSLHGLQGRVTVVAAGRGYTLRAGGLLVLPAGLPHALVAAEDSAVLITIAGPG